MLPANVPSSKRHSLVDTRMNFPPTKRLRGLNQDIPIGTTSNDPFGDDDVFSQDDLAEIDVLTSQAFTSTSLSGPASKPVSKPVATAGGSVEKGKLFGKTSATFNKESNLGFNSSHSSSKPSRDSHDQHFVADRNDASVLEAQHAELKRKLKEVEEEILLKNGEIRVLRDSLKGAQQEKETQRQNYIQQESQRQKEHSDREKELNRKVHSLQSELQFKEAEINEMKTKLLTSDKNKTASPLHRNSPKVLSSIANVNTGSSSSSSLPSSTGNGFITKEIFGASVPAKATPGKKRKESKEKATSRSTSGDAQEASRSDPFLLSTPVHPQSRGGVLLELMLQQPLFPSTLSLYHLLSINPADINQLYISGLPKSFRLGADAKVCGGDGGSALNPFQSLAVTGLNMMSLSRPDTAACNSNKRSCPGAVLLLPLLDVHLSQLFQTADSVRSGSHTAAACHSIQTDGPRRQEFIGSAGLSVEDIGLASLRLLYLLVVHSDEVVESMLSKENQISSKHQKCSQNALLQSILQCLSEGSKGGRGGPQREKLVLGAMKTLCALIERTPQTHSSGLQCVLQPLCACLSADSGLPTALQCVSVLTSACGHPSLAQHLCSQHDPCVFLKLFSFSRTRTDNQSTHRDWIQLNLQVVRLLSRLMSQGVGCWSSNSSPLSSCQCYTELVQMLVVVFHRQWLELRGPPQPAKSADSAPSPHAASLLRESLLLLHWLQLHHGSLPESSRPPLHVYDQVVPAVRDTLRKIPELSESEELALEEICRSESDDTDEAAADSLS